MSVFIEYDVSYAALLLRYIQYLPFNESHCRSTNVCDIHGR